ncbi:MAG: TetR family transcriptional regulator [Propionibacteriales bacterium]|nr:TetR family transcriptional regulator [Propionibacteriales bacterium]
MSTGITQQTPARTRSRVRAGLSRQQVLDGALSYIDEHGLAALSMHKLGEALGVKAMSLYNHVTNKDDLLNGVTDLLWSQVAPPPARADSWHDIARTLAASLREVVSEHPHPAHLLVSSQVLSEHALLLADTYRTALVESGLPESSAEAFLRTIVTYSLGYSLAELSWSRAVPEAGEDELAQIRRVDSLLPPGASDHLLRTAIWFCAECDTTEQFELGISLMSAGLDATLTDC